MNLYIEPDHPLEPMLRRWSARLPDGTSLRLWYGDPLPMPGPYHCCLAVQAQTKEVAEEATRSFFAILADGKRCYIRIPAGAADEHVDFLHMSRWWESWCRFSLYLEAGEAHAMNRDEPIEQFLMCEAHE